MNAPIRDAFDCSSRKPMRRYFVSRLPRALHEELNLGQECGSPLFRLKKITKISVGVVTRLTLKRQSERQREREVLISTHLLGRLRHKVLMTRNNSNYFKLILSDVSK